MIVACRRKIDIIPKETNGVCCGVRRHNNHTQEFKISHPQSSLERLCDVGTRFYVGLGRESAREKTLVNSRRVQICTGDYATVLVPFLSPEACVESCRNVYRDGPYPVFSWCFVAGTRMKKKSKEKSNLEVYEAFFSPLPPFRDGLVLGLDFLLFPTRRRK